MRLLFDFVIIFHGTFEACADVTLCSSCGKSEICINIWLKRSAAPGYTDLDFHALLHLKTFRKKSLCPDQFVSGGTASFEQCFRNSRQREFQLVAISSGIASLSESFGLQVKFKFR